MLALHPFLPLLHRSLYSLRAGEVFSILFSTAILHPSPSVPYHPHTIMKPTKDPSTVTGGGTRRIVNPYLPRKKISSSSSATLPLPNNGCHRKPTKKATPQLPPGKTGKTKNHTKMPTPPTSTTPSQSVTMTVPPHLSTGGSRTSTKAPSPTPSLVTPHGKNPPPKEVTPPSSSAPSNNNNNRYKFTQPTKKPVTLKQKLKQDIENLKRAKALQKAKALEQKRQRQQLALQQQRQQQQQKEEIEKKAKIFTKETAPTPSPNNVGVSTVRSSISTTSSTNKPMSLPSPVKELSVTTTTTLSSMPVVAPVMVPSLSSPSSRNPSSPPPPVNRPAAVTTDATTKTKVTMMAAPAVPSPPSAISLPAVATIASTPSSAPISSSCPSLLSSLAAVPPRKNQDLPHHPTVVATTKTTLPTTISLAREIAATKVDLPVSPIPGTEKVTAATTPTPSPVSPVLNSTTGCPPNSNTNHSCTNSILPNHNQEIEVPAAEAVIVRPIEKTTMPTSKATSSTSQVPSPIPTVVSQTLTAPPSLQTEDTPNSIITAIPSPPHAHNKESSGSATVCPLPSSSSQATSSVPDPTVTPATDVPVIAMPYSTTLSETLSPSTTTAAPPPPSPTATMRVDDPPLLTTAATDDGVTKTAITTTMITTTTPTAQTTTDVKVSTTPAAVSATPYGGIQPHSNAGTTEHHPNQMPHQPTYPATGTNAYPMKPYGLPMSQQWQNPWLAYLHMGRNWHPTVTPPTANGVYHYPYGYSLLFNAFGYTPSHARSYQYSHTCTASMYNAQQAAPQIIPSATRRFPAAPAPPKPPSPKFLAENILASPSPYADTHEIVTTPIFLLRQPDGPASSFGISLGVHSESSLVAPEWLEERGLLLSRPTVRPKTATTASPGKDQAATTTSDTQTPLSVQSIPASANAMNGPAEVANKAPRRRRRRRHVFSVMMVVDATKQNERGSGRTHILRKGDVVLRIGGQSTGGITFAEACQLFQSAAGEPDPSSEPDWRRVPVVVARRRPPPPPRIPAVPIPAPQPTAIIQPRTVTAADIEAWSRLRFQGLFRRSRLLGVVPREQELRETLALGGPNLGNLSLQELENGWQKVIRERTRLMNSRALQYWKTEWTKEDPAIRENTDRTYLSDAQRSRMRSSSRPANGCRCGSKSHHFVNDPACPLYSNLRQLQGFDSASSTTDTSPNKTRIRFQDRKLKPVEAAFAERVVREKSRKEKEEAEATFIDQAEELQLRQLGRAVFPPSLTAMIISSIAALKKRV